MDIAEITVALVAGVTLSLFFAEKTGIVPAGLVVPGYIALVVATPVYAISILFISFATYLVVMHVINRFTILYGRRKFAAMLLTGIILKLGFDTFFWIYSTRSSTSSSDWFDCARFNCQYHSTSRIRGNDGQYSTFKLDDVRHFTRIPTILHVRREQNVTTNI